MTTNSSSRIPINSKNTKNEHKLNLFKLKSDDDDDDWTRAIHHDLNIKRRTCTTFIPKSSATSDAGSSKDDIQCGCNRLRREHSWDIIDGNDREWDRKKHTESACNNAYGCIPNTHIHYIRCDIETHPLALTRLMFDVWKVKEPKLIMCITGGGKYFKLSERLEREFMKGIIQAALRADGWIVTTGFKTGVVQLVGEAIHDHKVTSPQDCIIAIGCSKWGAVKNRASFISSKVSTNNSNQGATTRSSKITKGQQYLEPNHSHFFLLDDGTYYGYDIGDYRTRFVLETANYKKGVPIVTIVVEGGPDTLLTIYRDLSNSIPVVLVDGSGRVPNLLANFLIRTDSMIHRNGKDNDGVNWKHVIDIKVPDDIEILRDYGINYSYIYESRSGYRLQRSFNYFRHLKQFHESPFIKFSYNAVSYIFFLLLFSYYLLFNFKSPTNESPSIHWTEILVIIIITTMLFEDIRQFLWQDSRSIKGKFYNYFIKDLFVSLIRITSYVLFYIGLILRFTYASTDENLSVAKIILAYDLEIWYIRSLAFLGVARNMGPKLVMIRKMIIDLLFFIYIILIAMIAYGVASRTMYKYNDDTDDDDLTFDGRSVFRHILYPSYYLMYGSTDKELTALDQNRDLGTSIATQVLLAFHMLFVNILLINLLIAMFSFTFESVQSQTDLVWRYERYSFIREYFDRPPLFPPFIIITHFIELIKFLIRNLRKNKNSNMKKRQTKRFKMIGANHEIDKDWSEFESYATNLCARTILFGQRSAATTLVPSAARQEVPSTTLDTINTSQLSSNIDFKAITDEIVSIKRAVGDLRTYAEEMNRCMQWMMDAMERVKMSKEPKPKLRSAVTTSDLKQTEE
ncbi:unnamed protein product [Rotaria sordida]|uniref:Uncharacterized protein n=1 Tax=Rotaria sordida TaxID=392033 RepID=A0A815C8K1_9BILA|nr:unnamed protein product [Rotaria sordida]